MDGFFRIFRSVGNAGDPVLIWESQALVVLKSDLMTRISGSSKRTNHLLALPVFLKGVEI